MPRYCISHPYMRPHWLRETEAVMTVLSAMQKARATLTLDNWLRWNLVDPDDPPDAELLEIIPACFYEEYCDRLRFWNLYESKWEGRARAR